MPDHSSLLVRCTGQVELRSTFEPRPNISHVVFDFDGTLSWLRHGWPEIMVDVFRERLPVAKDESPDDVDELLLNLIVSLNGKPTIFQMLRFVEVVLERGGPQLDAEMLRQEYQDRLDEAIAARSAKIRRGDATADDYVVWGARKLVERLHCEGLTLVILSSTVEERVREEAELLGIAWYFGPHIYGGRGDPTQFSKRKVFDRLLHEEKIAGEHLLSFGDGPVEIADTKALGGLAIAICSDENHNGSGEFDAFKRRQLLEAGADAALPDYRDGLAIFDYLRGK